MRPALAAAALVLTLLACTPPREPTPQPPLAGSLPTRVQLTVPTPVPTVTPTATPQASPSPRFVTTIGDPYAALYSTERDGLFVTTRRDDGRYYYAWDDRRWYAVRDRVWFRSVEDLKTVFPNRVPAP